MNKPVILTGLRANKDLHLGNYLGALLPLVDMANKHAGSYSVHLFVPDLHSFTTPIDHSQLYTQTMNNLKVFAAAGLDLSNPNVHIYRQSYISAHSELAWILDCFTGFGEMSRMTQFKDKSLKFNDDRVSVGLFNYPVLMAADVILYDAKYVPVGEDQTQHLEFIRDIAQRMNKRFGALFTVPEPLRKQHEFFGADQGLRVRDLLDPAKKMSKSDETGRGVIFLSDTPETATKKIMSAVTDSLGEIQFDMTKRPGISNLLQIISLLPNTPLDKVVNKYKGSDSYGTLKKDTAMVVADFLNSFQEKLKAVDMNTVETKLKSSEDTVSKQANAKLLLVQKAVGLRP